MMRTGKRTGRRESTRRRLRLRPPERTTGSISTAACPAVNQGSGQARAGSTNIRRDASRDCRPFVAASSTRGPGTVEPSVGERSRIRPAQGLSGRCRRCGWRATTGRPLKKAAEIAVRPREASATGTGAGWGAARPLYSGARRSTGRWLQAQFKMASRFQDSPPGPPLSAAGVVERDRPRREQDRFSLNADAPARPQSQLTRSRQGTRFMAICWPPG